MARKKKATLERAQITFLKALHKFEKAVAGMVTSPKPKAKAKRRTERRGARAR